MSTKSTITHGPTFHLYSEAFDNSNVYLELNEADFEASRDQVTLTIPAYIWEHIRQFAGVDLTWAGKTNEEIRLHVEKAVEERISRYQQNERSGLFGGFIYGGADETREQQIEAGINYLTKIRDQQDLIKEQIIQLS